MGQYDVLRTGGENNDRYGLSEAKVKQKSGKMEEDETGRDV